MGHGSERQESDNNDYCKIREAMTPSEILNILLGGGLLALVVGVITLKATVRKANAEAERAKAEAETVRITNTENATRILVENIVKPLKEELNATREELQDTKKKMASTQRTMSRLAKAVESVNDCRHVDECPVLYRLRVNPENGVAVIGDGTDGRNPGHDGGGHQADPSGGDTREPGGAGRQRGQPP